MPALPASGFHDSASRRERLRVLVKESGSAPLTAGGADAYDETVVIAQMNGEAPATFAERAVERVDALLRSGRSPSAVSLQTGPQHGAEVHESRATLLGHFMRRSSLTEVALEADSAEARGGSELMKLIDHVLSLPDDGAIPIRLRFRAACAASERDPGDELRAAEHDP